MRNLKVMYSKNSDHWTTPKHIYDFYINKGYIDPCPLNSTIDNLTHDWDCGCYFINPPYSDIKSWVDKAIYEHEKGRRITMLVPARTDTKWFHRLLDYGCHIQFIKGRLRFGEKGPAPFPSLLITLTKNQWGIEALKELRYD